MLKYIKKYLLLLIFLFCLNINLIFAEEKNQAENAETVSDSTNSVTVENKISETKNKTPETIFQTNKKIGTLLNSDEKISFHKIPEINYTNLSEILCQKQAFLPLFTGISGNSEYFSAFGANSSQNNLYINGVSIENIYSNADFDAIPAEFINEIEILFGSKSAVFGGSSGSTVNIQTSIFNVNKPYSRIWYNQGDNKQIGVDGTFSQNFLPNWNLTAGFRRISSNGFYQNSFVDSWNARFALRKNLSDFSAISLLYNFTNEHTGDFGGIFFSDYNSNENSPNQVRSNFENLSDRQYKNDLILNYFNKTEDSVFTVNSNLFFSNNENNILFKQESELLKIDSSGKNVANSNHFGLNSRAKYNLSKALFFDFGAELSYCSISKSIINADYSGLNYNIFGFATFEINRFTVAGGSRFEKKYDENLFAFGGNISANLGDFSLKSDTNYSLIFADLSFSNSAPIPIFDYKFEKHFLGLFGFKYRKNKYFFEANLFYRQIENPVLLNFSQEKIYTFSPEFVNINSRKIFGFVGKTTFELFKKIECTVTIQNYFDDFNKDLSGNFKPKFYFTSSLQYNYFKGTSKISGGICGSFLVNDKKLFYNPIFKSYSVSDLESSFSSDGLTAFISAKLGNAFVRASFKNILGANFSYLAYCPIQKRELILSLTWAFFN